MSSSTFGLDTVDVSGRSIKAAITEDCTILTVIDYRRQREEQNPLLEYLTEQELKELGEALFIQRQGGIDVREHNCVTAALDYLRAELIDDDWDRAYIINPTRLRYREQPATKKKRLR